MSTRKDSPYEVEFGAEGESPPPYVRLIMEDKIVLGGSSYKTYSGNEISFSGGALPEDNPQLIELMVQLNEEGFVFSYDPKSMISPCWFMKNLQVKGILRKSFKEISWRNRKQWVLTTYEIE